ncbi:MAG: RNA polymerase factor sigma-54 [Phycisphaerales bacterium JB039]
MRFDTSQQMRLGQQMKLAPRVIQSMEILQMPLAELEQRIEQELESNAALEQIEPGADGEAAPAEPEGPDPEVTIDDSGQEDFERLDAFEADNPDAAENQYSAAEIGSDYGRMFEDRPGPRMTRLEGERDGKLDAMAQTPARSASLVEQLQDQWSVAENEPQLRALGRHLISYIEDDGYLRTPLETIADQAPRDLIELLGGKPTVEQLEWTLAEAHIALEPPGTAARDARECLLLQLDAIENDLESAAEYTDDTLQAARWLVEDHLDDLMQNRLPKIVEKTSLTLDEIKQGIGVLRRLSLSPARRLVDDSPAPIRPDAVVEYDEEQDRYIAYLTDSRLPNLRINREYSEIVRDRMVSKRDRDFVRTNLSNAQWLLDAIEQRKNTLLRVINVVVDAQRDFFDYGPQSLRPLPMTQVAEQLGVHVATVSRAVSEKHLLTPRGIVPLRKFFTGGTHTDSGEEMSWDSIKATLKEIIDAEDKRAPLSDDALAAALKERGIDIARRTVAKYRDQLGAPTARLRKEF